MSTARCSGVRPAYLSVDIDTLFFTPALAIWLMPEKISFSMATIL